jgi:hypothetical protein
VSQRFATSTLQACAPLPFSQLLTFGSPTERGVM